MRSLANFNAILRDAVGIGIGTAAYGFGFGALAISTGFDVAQTMTLSAFMFTGASQFALVGVVGSGGSFAAALAATWLLGFRNLPYAITMKRIVAPAKSKIPFAAQLTIDESTAMALAHQDDEPTGTAAKAGFWLTGISVFVFWNLATLLGALAVSITSDPKALGLDAAISAGFVALLWPQLKNQRRIRVALIAAMVALLAIPFTAAGIPILLSGAVAAAIGLRMKLEQI
jgi:predicted branched-subunit amino acid permease